MALEDDIFQSAAARSKQLTGTRGLGALGFQPLQQQQPLLPMNMQRLAAQAQEDQPSTDAEALAIGKSIFGTNLPELSEDQIASMATDNPEDVDEGALDLYGSNPELAKILGATTKLAESGKATESLYKELMGKELTPEDAKKKVNAFFNLSEEDETPVWADVAVTVGLDLLSSDKELLPALGEAGKKGFAVAKERGKEKKARSNLLNQLAFGVYREDEKQRQNLLTQLSKFRYDTAEKQQKFALDIAKYLQEESKLDLNTSKAVSSAITNTINTVPNDLRGKAISVISKNASALGKLSPENVPNGVYSLLKEAGLDLETVDTAKNIVGADFTITDADTFNQYKAQFPKAFEGVTFEQGKEYKVKGFSDKGKEGALTSVLSVHSPIGTPNQLSQYQTRRSELKAAIANLPEGSPDRVALEQQLTEVQGGIEKLTTRDPKQSYLFDENGQLRAITGDLSGYVASEAQRIANEVDNSANNFVRAAAIGDSIMATIAAQPPGEEAGVMGVIGSMSNTINGLRGQLNAAVGFAGDAHGQETVDRYVGRDDLSHLYDSNERTISGQSAGSVFKRFDELTKDRQELRSAIYDYAFALAGSRETGKLTDKDVANAMITLGGGDIADGKWFASPVALVTGVNKALDLAANGLAPRWNSTMQKSIDAAVQSGDMTEDEALAMYRFDPVKLVKRRSMDPTLYERLQFDGGKVQYQNLDRYRGTPSGGDITLPAGLSPTAQSAVTRIRELNTILQGSDAEARAAATQEFETIYGALSPEDQAAVSAALTGSQ